MLEILRKYQRYIFIVVTGVVIASFTFFGTYSTIGGEEKRVDRTIGELVDGSKLQLFDVQRLSHFIASDREDLSQGRNQIPNLANDGVIRYDFLRTHLADLAVAAYFDQMKSELAQRLERAKKYRPYVHPDAPFISARLVWERFLPAMNEELSALQEEKEVSPAVFTRLSRLYQQQSYFQPELLRRFLVYQHQQYPWLSLDQRLGTEDLSLFGFHTIYDWFGPDFPDLIAQFILNAAAAAEEKGYSVSLEEAKGDLIHNFQQSIEKMAKSNLKPELSFGSHLRMIGFDEKSASEIWQKVLLFRRYFQDVGQATFVDRLPYKDFAGYAQETAVVQKYSWPFRLRNFNDLLQFEVYLKAVATASKNPLALPRNFKKIDEVAAQFPELVQTSYRASVIELSKAQIGLKASLKEIWDWEAGDPNWAQLKKEFSFLPKADSRDERFKALEKLDPAQRAQVTGHARGLLVDAHPAWIEEAFAAGKAQELTLPVSDAGLKLPHIEKGKAVAALLEKTAAGEEAAKTALLNYSDDGKTIYRFENVAKVSERQILTFEKARPVLGEIADRMLEQEYPKIRSKNPQKFQDAKGEFKPFADVKQEVGTLYFADLLKAIDQIETNDWKPGQGPADYYASHRLLAPAQEAYTALRQNPSDSLWLKGEGDPLAEQFKLERKQLNVQRTSQEDWMKEQAFVLVPNDWSPIHVPNDGQIVFFYLQEKKESEAPILEQLSFGKETLAADAQRFLAEKLLAKIQKKHSIVIPVKKEIAE